MNPENFSLYHLHRPALVEEALPPLLILLHGFGRNEQDLFKFAPLFDSRFVILSARGPNQVGRNGYAYFQVQFNPQGDNIINQQQAQDSTRRIIQFIGEASEAYGTDPQRVYLMGFSQGAIMSTNLALTQPELVAGAVLHSGRILKETLPNIVPAERLKNLAFLLIHGLQDEVLSIEHGRKSREILEQLPVELTYREYNISHTITPESLTQAKDWLSAQLDKKAQNKSVLKS